MGRTKRDWDKELEQAAEVLRRWNAGDKRRLLRDEEAMDTMNALDSSYSEQVMHHPKPGIVTVRKVDGSISQRPMTEAELAAWKETLDPELDLLEEGVA